MRPPSPRPNYDFMYNGPADTNSILNYLLNLADELIGFRHQYFVKVGITNNPENRWYSYNRNEPYWEDMIVLVKTRSLQKVRNLERIVSENFRRENLIRGGGGNFGAPPYYLYYVVTKRDNLDFPRRKDKKYYGKHF